MALIFDPIHLEQDNIFKCNRTLNPQKVGEAFYELSRPRYFEETFKLPIFIHNATVQVLNERVATSN